MGWKSVGMERGGSHHPFSTPSGGSQCKAPRALCFFYPFQPDYDLLLNMLRSITINKPEPAFMNGSAALSLTASRCTLCQQTLPKRSKKLANKPPDTYSLNEMHLLDISGIKTAPDCAEHLADDDNASPNRKISNSTSALATLG